MLNDVKANRHADAGQVLADTGYRSEAMPPVSFLLKCGPFLVGCDVTSSLRQAKLRNLAG